MKGKMQWSTPCPAPHGGHPSGEIVELSGLQILRLSAVPLKSLTPRPSLVMHEKLSKSSGPRARVKACF